MANNGVYFNASKLPKPINSYVAWIDVMGIRAIMSRSIQITANFVFKLHSAALEVLPATNSLTLYPVMDGIFVVSKRQEEILVFLGDLMKKIAYTFVEQEIQHRFLVKAALAYGPVTHGREITPEANQKLGGNEEYKNSLLIGMPMIQAYQSESKAPPFGIFIHESARAFSPSDETPIPHVWWRWLNRSDSLRDELRNELESYFKWCEDHPLQIEYAVDRIKIHKEMVKQYLDDQP